jgi:hypothetical protein
MVRYPGKSALALFVSGVFTNHADNALPLDELAFFANALNAGSHFHVSLPVRSIEE